MIALRYFDITGRAQPLRHALADAGVDFEDVRVTPLEWRKRRGDAQFGGPFRALPTLTWDDVTVAETLPIASYLGRRLAQTAGLDDAAIAARDAIASLAYLEVLVPMGELFWIGVVYDGVDLAKAFAFRLSRMIGKLELLDAQLPDRGWIGGAAPVVADFFAAEALEALRHVLGPDRDAALAARLPTLAALAAAARARPAIARRERPARLTSHPDEDALVARLRALDLDL